MLPEAGEALLDLDPRFRFAWRKPVSGRGGGPLLAVIHGSDRNWLAARDAFGALADQHDMTILAPLFPGGVANAELHDGYKFLREPGIDYALLFDAMLASLAGQCRFNGNRIFLFGFSGGAQFALRYALINASRLAGLVVAAPGNVTLLDDRLPWWGGTRDIETVTGKPLDRTGLLRLPVHLIVGENDLDKGLVERGPGDPYHSPHAGLAGATRKERLTGLHRSLSSAGVATTLDIVKNAEHDFAAIAGPAARSLNRMMSSCTASGYRRQGD